MAVLIAKEDWIKGQRLILPYVGEVAFDEEGKSPELDADKVDAVVADHYKLVGVFVEVEPEKEGEIVPESTEDETTEPELEEKVEETEEDETQIEPVVVEIPKEKKSSKPKK